MDEPCPRLEMAPPGGWAPTTSAGIVLLCLLFNYFIAINKSDQSVMMMAVSEAVPKDGRKTSSDEPPPRTRLYIRQSDPLPPPINGTVRLVVLSDTHGKHDEIPLPLPDGDILLHLGDACHKGDINQMRSFVKWMKKNSFHKERIVIDGNHDQNITSNYGKKQDFMAEYKGVARVMKNEVVEIANGSMAIAGMTWDECSNNDFSEVKYNVQKWNHINESFNGEGKRVDLVLSHFPPNVKGGGRGWHGSSALTDFVKDLSPSLHLFGHIHYARGVRSRADITMVNCASTWNEPVVIDYCPNEKKALMIYCPLPNDSMDRIDDSRLPKDWLLPG